jgi:tetratricopeptide (TPR) repeat protein
MMKRYLGFVFAGCCRLCPAAVLAWSCAIAGLLPFRAHAADAPQPSRGVQLFQQHEFEKAVNAFMADLRVNSDNDEALFYLGRIAFEENRLDAAAKHFERVTALAPEKSEGFHWLGRVSGLEARALGAPRGIGAARRTRKNLEKAVALNPDNLEARADLATFYREAPLLVGGSKRAAAAQVQEIARRSPYFGALGQGDLMLADKKYDEAQRQYQSAARLEPLKPEAYFRLGMLYQRTGRYDEAFAQLEKTLQLDPAQMTAHFQIGKTADLSGQRLDQGEAALKTYLQCKPFYLMPTLSWAYRRLGNIYLKKGFPEKAREQYLAALRVAPDDHEAAAALKDLEAKRR